MRIGSEPLISPLHADLLKRRKDFGNAVVGTLIVKFAFKVVGGLLSVITVSGVSLSDTAEVPLQILALIGSAAVFFWLATTSFRCAASIGWRRWQCWLIAIVCGVLQWVAWAMYFVFCHLIAKKLAALTMAEGARS